MENEHHPNVINFGGIGHQTTAWLSAKSEKSAEEVAVFLTEDLKLKECDCRMTTHGFRFEYDGKPIIYKIDGKAKIEDFDYPSDIPPAMMRVIVVGKDEDGIVTLYDYDGRGGKTWSGSDRDLMEETFKELFIG